MNEKRVEGVVLRSIPHKENDRILTIFTPDRGVISLYIGRVSKKRPVMINLTTPLCRGEFIFKKGRTDLYRFLDGTILDLHLPMRRSYRHLEVGGKILQALIKTQLPGKDSHVLYFLLLAFLKKLPETENPEVLWGAFQLKLLKHEGLLDVTKNCRSCKKEPAMQIVEGESRCHACGGIGGIPFKDREWDLLCTLFETRSFEVLFKLDLSESLLERIETCFRNVSMI